MAKQTALVSPAVAEVARFASLAPVADYDPFPKVDPGARPTGSDVLIQVRSPKTKSKGGIFLVAESIETDYWNIQVGLVRAFGPLAYHNRETMKPWPEGAWCNIGDFVRIPKFGGDRWEIDFGPDDKEKALFVLFRDTEIRAVVTGDPNAIKAYVK